MGKVLVTARLENLEDVYKAGQGALPADQVRDNQRVLPGEGVIDLAGFFQALKQIGYHDGVSPEPPATPCSGVRTRWKRSGPAFVTARTRTRG